MKYANGVTNLKKNISIEILTKTLFSISSLEKKIRPLEGR